MKNFRPDLILAQLESLRRLADEKPADTTMFSTPGMKNSLAVLWTECRNADLPLSLIWIQRIESALAPSPRPITHGEFPELAHALFHRFCDELAVPPPRFLAISAQYPKPLQPGPPFD